MTSPETPEWVRDAVFYQIFPDRFAHSDRIAKPSNLESWHSPPTVHGFKGGDLLGVLEHLDYLQDLGVTAIYFNPIFQSVANHRYHTHDYYAVDPILGGNQALRILLDEAHRRGMRIVLDGVFNHASRSFFQFSHIVENGPASPYVDWFIVKQYPLRPYHAPRGQHGYAAWWDMPALPKLNVATPAVREFLWEVATYWIDFGIDGWRLDVPAEIDDDEFWCEFRRRVKAANPEAYIVGEIWHKATRWLRGDQFDAVMNYLFTRICLGFFAGENLLRSEVAQTGYHSIDTRTAQEFSKDIDGLLSDATVAFLLVMSGELVDLGEPPAGEQKQSDATQHEHDETNDRTAGRDRRAGRTTAVGLRVREPGIFHSLPPQRPSRSAPRQLETGGLLSVTDQQQSAVQAKVVPGLAI